MEIQLLLPWSAAARQANDAWDTKGFREQILSNGCKVRYYSSGTKYWYNQYNQWHHLDDPAVEYPNGDKEWWQNNQRHRLDGPAIEYSNGSKFWYIKGKPYTEKDFNLQVKGSRSSPNT